MLCCDGWHVSVCIIVADCLMFPAIAIHQVSAKHDAWDTQSPRFVTIIVTCIYFILTTFYGRSFTANWSKY